MLDNSRPMLAHEYRASKDKSEAILEVVGGAGVRGGEGQKPHTQYRRMRHPAVVQGSL